MRTSRMTTATATAAVVILAGSAVALAASDPTPTPPPRIAFVARGDGTNFADALAAGSVAGQLGAPVFTTPATSLAEDTRRGLTNYNPEVVFITGGEAAISADVEAAIRSSTGLPDDKVRRLAGANRYDTAALLAEIFDTYVLDAAYLPVGARATDAELLDGKDAAAFQPSGDYALAGEFCAPGEVIHGISIEGTPFCVADAVDGGNAQTLSGREWTEMYSGAEGTNASDYQLRTVDGTDGADSHLKALLVHTPTDGYLVINAFIDWRDPIGSYMSVQLNDPTCNNIKKPSQVIFVGGEGQESLAGTGMVHVPAGSSTLTLCAGEFSVGSQTLDRHAITGVFMGDINTW